MKIFIGKISPKLDADIIYDCFKTFGEIANYKFKGQYAFVEYKNILDAEKVLEKREIDINGCYVIVEESNSRNSYKNESYNSPTYRDDPGYRRRSEPYDSRYEKNYDNRSYNDSRYTNYNTNFDNNFSKSYINTRDDYYKRDNYMASRSERDECPYCSRCERHGTQSYARRDYAEHKRPRRDHPNDINKIVIENLPYNVDLYEIDEFIKSYDLSFIFSKLTYKKNSVIVEFKDIETKNLAIEKLKDQEFKGTRIYVREFRVNYTPVETRCNDNDIKSSGYIETGNKSSPDNIDDAKEDQCKEKEPHQDSKHEEIDIYSGLDK